MGRKWSAHASGKRLRLGPTWGTHLLLGALAVVAFLAAGALTQMLWASALPEQVVSAAASNPFPPTHEEVVRRGAGGDSGARTLNLYGGDMQPLVEEKGGVETLNIYGPGGQIIDQVEQGGPGSLQVRHLLTDHLGSTRAVLDAEGNGVARYEYAPYGGTAVAGAAGTEVRYRYTGHRYDGGQEVYETPARGYEPTVGRFLSVDPQRQGASPYVYAGNNPVGFVDPTRGGKVPYFMKSGLQSADPRGGRNGVAASIADLFGREPGQYVTSSGTFKQSEGGRPSSARNRPKRTLYGRSENKAVGDHDYNDKLFWIMDEKEDVPDDLYLTLDRLHDFEEDFAAKVIILDFTQTGNGEGIRSELELHGLSTIVIEGSYTEGSHRSLGIVASGFRVGDENLNLVDFQAHVNKRISGRWPGPELQSTSTLPTNLETGATGSGTISSPSTSTLQIGGGPVPDPGQVTTSGSQSSLGRRSGQATNLSFAHLTDRDVWEQTTALAQWLDPGIYGSHAPPFPEP